MATKHLAQGDRKQAMTMLRIPEYQTTQYSQLVYWNGLSAGFALVMTVLNIYYYFFVYSQIYPAVHDIREMFMYRLILFPILMIVFIAINVSCWSYCNVVNIKVRIWTSVGINYVFIFELDARKHMSKWTFMLIPFVLYNVWSVSFFSYMFFMNNHVLEQVAWLHPTILTVALMGWFLLPFRALMGGARYWVCWVQL